MAINYKCLLKLADFLYKLPRSHFDFSVTRCSVEPTKRNECGTIGCAMGWTPSVFPSLVEVICVVSIRHVPSGRCGYIEVAQELFGISYEHGLRLFTPHERAPGSNKSLGDDATPKQVARRIRKYVAWSKKQAAK